jgi:hypothetical protein
MSKDINTLKNQLKVCTEAAKDSNINDLLEFETYYKPLQNDGLDEAWYSTDPKTKPLTDFVETLLDWNTEYKNGKLDDNEKKAFEEVLDTIQQENDSALKTMIRTSLLDLCATMNGDLESEASKKSLDKAMNLAELYNRVLNANEKESIKKETKEGVVDKFLLNVDPKMTGNLSKTLKAFYNKHKAGHTREDSEKWKKFFRSYAIGPYMNAMSKKALQNEKEIAVLNNTKVHPEEAELSPILHRYFADKPEKVASKAATLRQETKKDSQQFKDMHDALDKLFKTNGYTEMEKLLSKGTKEEVNALIGNIDKSIDCTKKYIAYAKKKSSMQMGFLGHSRLSAAKDTLKELEGLRRGIDKDMIDFLQKRFEKKEKLDNLEKMNLTHSNKISIKDLSTKVSGKMTMDGWVTVNWSDVVPKDNTKKTDKAAGPSV